MCQEHRHFDVQVARRQGGAGLPSAVRLALAGSAYALAGLRRPPGLSGLWGRGQEQRPGRSLMLEARACSVRRDRALAATGT